MSNIEWKQINIGVIIEGTLRIDMCFNENEKYGHLELPKGTVIRGSFQGVMTEDDEEYVRITVVINGERTVGIATKHIGLRLINVSYCFRCDKYRRNEEFRRHPNTPDKSPILSTICETCYRRIKNQIASHRSLARLYGGKTTLKVSDWLELLKNSQGCCSYCNQNVGYGNLIIEHKTPLSLKGDHTRSNVVPSCIPCNSSKGARDIDTWQRNTETKQLFELLQDHFNLSKFEITQLAIRRLAIQEGLLNEDDTEAQA